MFNTFKMLYAYSASISPAIHLHSKETVHQNQSIYMGQAGSCAVKMWIV